MARSRRTILFSDYDTVRRFNDQIAGWNTRDVGGLPLGNVQAHAENRLAICYQILRAVELARQFDLVNPLGAIEATGAKVQDKRGTRDYPAAHLAPCGISVQAASSAGAVAAAGGRCQLYAVFRSGVTVSFVQGLFGATENVHKFVNYADSRMEETSTGRGLSAVLVKCCGDLLRDRKQTARAKLLEVVVPDFKKLAGDFLKALQDETAPGADLSMLLDHTGLPFGWQPPEHQITGLLDAYGRPLTPRPADVSVRTKDPEALLHNMRALEKVFGLYVGVKAPTASDLVGLDRPFAALELNERQA